MPDCLDPAHSEEVCAVVSVVDSVVDSVADSGVASVADMPVDQVLAATSPMTCMRIILVPTKLHLVVACMDMRVAAMVAHTPAAMTLNPASRSWSAMSVPSYFHLAVDVLKSFL